VFTLPLLALLSQYFLPVLLVYPVLAGWMIAYVRSKQYLLYDFRVVERSGIFYKREKSILFSKIDHINSSQGLFNKVFHNGNVIINTTGSNIAEMVASDLKDYRQLFEALKKNY
jgi:uncharacterized membrane protein YdbT with pleckstrin-like domain